jgi:dimethylhistidine N-methyltransferase
MLEQFKQEVDEGLSNYPKSLPSKYFYDKKGDSLFVKIMHLPEYYLTRAELEIFTKQSQNMIDALAVNQSTYFELIELGAGDGLKTKQLLKALNEQNYNFSFTPIDISQNSLNIIEKNIKKDIKNISINKKQGDYFKVLSSLKDNHNPKVLLFLGSNIGNMTDEVATDFIYKLGSNLSPNDKLILGVDLIKSASIVMPAYNDKHGVTKEFNLNLLDRINNELGADFNIDNFSHKPEYQEKDGIAKSFLVSDTEQNVYIDKIKKTFYFKKGEKIETEISRKYNRKILQGIIANTDFQIIKQLNDSNNYFSNYILERF